MKKLTLIALLFTSVSFGATFSQEIQNKLHPATAKACVDSMQKADTGFSLKLIQDYCDCGARKSLALPISDQNDEQAVLLAVEPCFDILTLNN